MTFIKIYDKLLSAKPWVLFSFKLRHVYCVPAFCVLCVGFVTSKGDYYCFRADDGTCALVKGRVPLRSD